MRRFLSLALALALAATVLPAASACSQEEDDKSFFPVPDAGHRTYNDHDGHIIYMAYIGRFASYADLTGSPFYNLLLQNFPELAGIKGYAVSTTDEEEDVWMVVPTKEGIFASIREYNKEMESGAVDYETGKVYYLAEDNMTPILLHTSMESPGSVMISVSDSESESMCFLPQYTEPNNELMCLDADRAGDDYWPTVPSRLAAFANGAFWCQEDGSFSIRFFLNNRFVIKTGNGETIWGTCFPYISGGRLVLAVKTEDGHRAVWDFDQGDLDSATLRQTKGEILPKSGTGIVLKAGKTES